MNEKELNKRAAAAGVTLKAVLDARTVKDYEQAIKDLNDAIAFQDSGGIVSRRTRAGRDQLDRVTRS